jgi:glutathione S-transferase
MILFGRYRSPFTRRVAIAMHIYGFAYEHRPITAWNDLEELRRINPVGRVPALQLDSGELLFDSYAILDYLDQLAGPHRALLPAAEPRRHEVQRMIACAMGALEKMAHAVYAKTMVPPEKIHAPWVEHSEAQASSALRWLDAIEPSPWLAGQDLTHADVATVVMFDFIGIANPRLVDGHRYPKLRALSARANELPAFRQTFPSSSVDRAIPALRAQ